MKSENGITLISLAITIMIIIILAGVAIYTGKSAIDSSQVAKFTADMKLIQSQVNTIYEEIKLGDTSYYNTGRAIDSLTVQTKTRVDTAMYAEGLDISNKTDFRYFNESDLELSETDKKMWNLYTEADKQKLLQDMRAKKNRNKKHINT